MLSFEIALPIGAIAFYLYDCLLLLYDNEIVFTRRSASWRATSGTNLVFMGKRIAMPGVLAPWSLLIRTFWSEGKASAVECDTDAMQRLGRALLPARWLCTAMLVVLCVALPVVSVLRGPGIEMLLVFVLMYLLVIACVAVLIYRRRALGLNGKALWILAIDALACAPFAVNLVAKVMARVAPAVESMVFSRCYCDAEEQQHVLALLAARPGRAEA